MAGAKAADKRQEREHPFAHEASTELEGRFDPLRVTGLVLGGATLLTVVGLYLQGRFGYEGPHFVQHASWDQWTLLPLFAGLALLGFGFSSKESAKRLTLVGWVLFAFYWALTARDLFVKEGHDYVNFVFALVGVYLFVYLAYQQWLDLVRGVHTPTLHFLNVSTFIAAGAYFLIDKITILRIGLIRVVSDHTMWMLDLFGQGERKGLVFLVDHTDSKSPTTFFYPESYCSKGAIYPVNEYCAGLPADRQEVLTTPEPSGFLDSLLFYSPGGESLTIVPVSIILACTAIQSIMLFVGLFAGTPAPWAKRIKASVAVGALVYILNLVRNTGIIWFYGQGHASFWVMHNAIGKGGSLLAILGIAFAVFRFFPEFFRAIVGVLDLPHRDGPLERVLRLGRRRPENLATA